MSYLIRYACFLRIFFLNPIIHIASISPSVKHAAIFLRPVTRGSFKTVYEDPGAEGGPILCQRVFHQLFNPPPSKVVFQFTSSTILRIPTVFFLDFFWGVDLISVGDTLIVATALSLFARKRP